MKKFTLTVAILIFIMITVQSGLASPSDSVKAITKEALCKNWVLKEYKENGKVQPLFEYEIEFFANGKYVETEEDETDKGTWKFNENKTAILFDVGTLDEDEFYIVSFDPEKMVVKLLDDDNFYHFMLVPEKE